MVDGTTHVRFALNDVCRASQINSWDLRRRFQVRLRLTFFFTAQQISSDISLLFLGAGQTFLGKRFNLFDGIFRLRRFGLPHSRRSSDLVIVSARRVVDLRQGFRDDRFEVRSIRVHDTSRDFPRNLKLVHRDARNKLRRQQLRTEHRWAILRRVQLLRPFHFEFSGHFFVRERIYRNRKARFSAA